MGLIQDYLEVAGAENLASDPTPAFEGRFYWNTVAKTYKVYNGTTWISLSDTAVDTDAYVGTDPEPGGSSPFTLTATDNRTQIIDPAGPITIILDDTAISEGSKFTIVNRSLFRVTIEAVDNSQIDVLDTGTITIRATTTAPADNTGWYVEEIKSTFSFTPTASNPSSTLSLSDGKHYYTRMNNYVTVYGNWVFSTVSGGPTSFNVDLPVPVVTAFANQNEITGVGQADDSASGPGYPVYVVGDIGNQKALVHWDNSGGQSSKALRFTFCYIQRQ